MSDAAQTVLIVDDEPSLLRMMETYLTRRGFAVLTSPSTDLAWEQVRDRLDSLDVAVLDFTIPGLSATELGVRLLAGNPRLQVIIASGYPASLEELEAAGAGRVSFLHKPFTTQMLVERLRLPPAASGS